MAEKEGSSGVMRRAIIPLALLCSASPGVADDFATVMRRAQQSEGALEPQQMVRLVEAQGSAMQLALTRCTPRRSTIPDKFAVVLRIDTRGRAVDSWTKNSTEFERCFAATMRERIHFIPPITPFYTSIEYERRQFRENKHAPVND